MLLLKRHRIATGKTITQVASQLGVTPISVSRWENGLRAPRPGHLKKLARLLGMSPFDLSLIIEPDIHPGIASLETGGQVPVTRKARSLLTKAVKQEEADLAK